MVEIPLNVPVKLVSILRPSQYEEIVDSLFIPESQVVILSLSLRNAIDALPLTPTGFGGAEIGVPTKLQRGSQIDICGMGFNPLMLKVRFEGRYYFIFRSSVPEACWQ